MNVGVTVGDSIARVERTGEPFDFVEFGFPEVPAITEHVDESGLREAVDSVGVALDVHLPYQQVVATPIPEVNEAILEYFERLLQFAGDLDARKAVLHGTVRNPSDTTLRPVFADQLRDISEAGEAVGVEVVVENVGHQRLGLPLSVLGEFAEKAEASVCFDCGHAYMEGGNDAIDRFLSEYRHLVSHLHIHDARSRGDTHIPAGAGEIEYDLLTDHLSGFDGTTAIEVFTDDGSLLADTADRIRTVLEPEARS